MGATGVDADTAAFLAALRAAEAPPITAGTPDDARAGTVEFLREVGIDAVDVAEVEDVEIRSGRGAAISVRRYRATEDPTAVFVFFHGGGWVICDVETHDPLCRLIAANAGVEVVSVDYRLAPEHPYPAGLDDCYAAACWAAKEVARGRPLIVGGDSAGGNLAAAVALRARDSGSPAIALQVLLYPVLDHDLETDSYARLGEGHLLTRDDMAWFLDQYAPDSSMRNHPYLSPLRADDLTAVAPAFIVVGGLDPLSDEAHAYAARLQRASVAVRLDLYSAFIHGFLTMPKAIPSTQRAIDETVRSIREMAVAVSSGRPPFDA